VERCRFFLTAVRTRKASNRKGAGDLAALVVPEFPTILVHHQEVKDICRRPQGNRTIPIGTAAKNQQHLVELAVSVIINRSHMEGAVALIMRNLRGPLKSAS
jgi:hypothetical protein